MYNRIGVIGVGSIGAYIAKHIHDSEITKELFIIDYDFVEIDNLKNSIYKKSDVGKFKVDALLKIIRPNSLTKIKRSRKKYEIGITRIPKCNILIDCRDHTYDRLNDVHVRLYMSTRFLCIDCRTNIKYTDKLDGVYNSCLSKNDLKMASVSFVQLLDHGFIDKMIISKDVFSINIDSTKEEISNTLSFRDENEGLIIDSNENCDKIVNLIPDCQRILKDNQSMDALFYIGDKDNPIVKKEILKNTFKNENDIIKFISSIKFPFNYPSYYLNVNVNNQILHLNLLPETGAA